MQVLGIELVLPGLTASLFTHRTKLIHWPPKKASLGALPLILGGLSVDMSKVSLLLTDEQPRTISQLET